MGRRRRLLEFMKYGLGATDRVHLAEGNVLGQRLLAALFEDIRARLAAESGGRMQDAVKRVTMWACVRGPWRSFWLWHR